MYNVPRSQEMSQIQQSSPLSQCYEDLNASDGHPGLLIKKTVNSFSEY